MKKEPFKKYELSPLELIRKYHNIEKRNLILKYTKKQRVLDLGSGTGGDLDKYESADISQLFLVEPSPENESQLRENIPKRTHDILPRIKVIKAKGEEYSIIKEHVSLVDVVSSFFSMTFLFESDSILDRFLYTVEKSVAEGGYFMGTMMEGTGLYQFLEETNTDEVRKLGKDISIKKQYTNQPPSMGMKIEIDLMDTIVQKQTEYLAFFSILQSKLEAKGFELIERYDFTPETEKSLLIDHPEIQSVAQFSKFNIGFVFQKLPLQIHTDRLPVDETYEFINLYKEKQVWIRTGVKQKDSLFRSVLFNTQSVYRTASSKMRSQMVSDFKLEFHDWLNGREESIGLLMEWYGINIYIIDAHTRRPVKQEGYVVFREYSTIITVHEDASYEPLAINEMGTATRLLSRFDPYLSMIHRISKK